METIYGWSWKSWEDHYLIAFDSVEEAKAWLHTEEYDFRERELISAEKAAELAGDLYSEWDESYKLQLGR